MRVRVHDDVDPMETSAALVMRIGSAEVKSVTGRIAIGMQEYPRSEKSWSRAGTITLQLPDHRCVVDIFS